jgi:hypothetical protein
LFAFGSISVRKSPSHTPCILGQKCQPPQLSATFCIGAGMSSLRDTQSKNNLEQRFENLWLIPIDELEATAARKPRF